MSTPAQIAANQANAKLSTGPTSDIGKQIASQDSVKHQLTGKGNPALPGEHDAVEEHFQGYFQTYAPVGTPEEDLVRSLADNNWRLRRVSGLERRLLIQLETVEPEALDETLKELRRVALYGDRIQRTIEKSRAELRLMQSEPKAAYAQAQEEAILLTQIAYAKGQTVEAAKDFPSPELCGGFVYSLPEILRILDREARLEEAKTRFVSGADLPDRAN